MSPASYLTAPPRGVGSSIAEAPREPWKAGDHETGAENRHTGEGVEDEVVARDDDREHDDDRVDRSQNAQGRVLRIADQAEAHAERPARVKTGDRGDGIRDGRRVRRADVDVPEHPDRVLDAEPGEQARRSRRELPEIGKRRVGKEGRARWARPYAKEQ